LIDEKVYLGVSKVRIIRGKPKYGLVPLNRPERTDWESWLSITTSDGSTPAHVALSRTYL